MPHRESFGLEVGAEHPEHGVKVNQLGAELLNPFLELANFKQDLGTLGDKGVCRDRVAFVVLGHAAFSRCQ